MIKYKKADIISFLFFVFSPILSFPFILFGIYKKRRFNLLLIVILLGILSYFYVPSITDDRVRYIDLFNLFETFSFGDFLAYIKNRGLDFIFHTILFVFAKLGLGSSLCFMFLTIVTTYYIFFSTLKLLEKNNASGKIYISTIVIMMLSISIPTLFSGIRFYLSVSFVYAAIVYGIFMKNNRKSLLFFILACLTHFSSLIFFIFYIFFVSIKNSNKTCRTLFLLSILNITLSNFILPILVDAFSSFFYNTPLFIKLNTYLGGSDFLIQSIEGGSKGTFYILLISRFWLVFAYLYLFITPSIKSVFRNLVYTLIFFNSIFYSVPTVFNRYLLLLKMILLLLILCEHILYNKKYAYYILGLFFFIQFSTDIYILRYNILASFFNTNMVSSISMYFIDNSNLNYIK